jgi:hypothetical protein
LVFLIIEGKKEKDENSLTAIVKKISEKSLFSVLAEILFIEKSNIRTVGFVN